MESAELTISQKDLYKLLCAGNGDAALLYLYLKSGNPPDRAEADLRMTGTGLACATAMLHQLGLCESQRQPVIFSGERPAYTEKDVMLAMNTNTDFSALYGEVQRQLGRTLNTEELKILLGFVNYLGLPVDVICLLINYCRQRAYDRGSHRNPSLRTIEKEAYAWAEQGIDTMEEAAAFIQKQTMKRSRMGKLMEILQIRGRTLTVSESKYAESWLDMGFDDEAITAAYERTCLNTGGLRWPYMNKILTSWHEAGLHTAEQIRTGDRKPVPKGATGQLGDAELEAIQQMLKEG